MSRKLLRHSVLCEGSPSTPRGTKCAGPWWVPAHGLSGPGLAEALLKEAKSKGVGGPWTRERHTETEVPK